MTKSVGSLIYDGQHRGRERGVVHFSVWSAFSRKLYDAIGCGVSQQQQQHCDDDDDDDDDDPQYTTSTQETEKEKEKEPHFKKLCDILETSESCELEMGEESETKRKVGKLVELQSVVKKLDEEGKEREGAMEIRRLAKDDCDARQTLAMLGAIPPLVSMLDSSFPHLDSLYALLNLSIGNDMNKEAIVKAGAVHKMLKLIDEEDEQGDKQEAIVAIFLCLSALDSNKPIIGASGAIPFLVTRLQNLLPHNLQPKQDCLKAIYNLSIFPLNVTVIVEETDLIQILLKALGDMEVSGWILSILTNIVSTPGGRKAVSNTPDAIPILIDPLNWTDSPASQEKASYILMVMAHKGGYADRQSMVEAGIISSLLELTLIGTALAQKRASRILECLRMDKGKQNSVGLLGIANNGASVSAPICGAAAGIESKQQQHQQEEEQMMSEESKAVKQLVQQSLHKNMRLIIKRANLPQHFVPSQHITSLTISSKSLPF